MNQNHLKEQTQLDKNQKSAETDWQTATAPGARTFLPELGPVSKVLVGAIVAIGDLWDNFRFRPRL